MIAPLLFAYCAALTAAGIRWLPRSGWPRRFPRLGIAAWQALTVTVLLSAALGGLVLAVPATRLGASPAGLLRACTMALRARYSTPAGAATGVAGGLLALAVPARLAWYVASALAAAARHRGRHDDALTLVARTGPVPGTLLLDHDQPAAYCLPGRRRIVLTTGALHRLNGRQLEAVLAHERAHLAARHHLVLAFAAAMSSAFPLVLFTAAASEIGRLVEMAADDAASRHAHRLDLAGALLALATARVPAGSLGAGGTAAAQRVRRLIEPPRPAGRARGAVTAVVVAAAVPMLTLSAPAMAAVAAADCQAHGAAVMTSTHGAGPSRAAQPMD